MRRRRHDLPRKPDAQIQPAPVRSPDRLPVLVFYQERGRHGLGLDGSLLLVKDPAFGRLVVEDARKLLDRLEEAIKKGKEDTTK